MSNRTKLAVFQTWEVPSNYRVSWCVNPSKEQNIFTVSHAIMAEGSGETMDDLLTCSLCLELFKEPKTLTCLHSYCFECLKEMTKSKKEIPIACPLCREETAMPCEGIEGLPTNFFIKNMLDVVQMRSNKGKTQCTNCQEGLPAKCRCMDCELFFCEQCLDAHERLRPYSEHRVIDLEKLLSPDGSKDFHPAMKCLNHKVLCNFYCQSCNVLICHECTVVYHPHSSHRVAELKDIVGRYRERYLEAMNKAEKQMAKLKHVQVVTQERKKNLETSFDHIKIELTTMMDYFIQQVSTTLQSRVSEMLSELEQFVSFMIQQDEKNEERQRADLKKVSNYVLFMHNLLASGNDDEIMNMYEHLARCLDDVSGRDPFWLDRNTLVDPEVLPQLMLNKANDHEVQAVIEMMKGCFGKLPIPKVSADQYELHEDKGKVYELGVEVEVLVKAAGGDASSARPSHPELMRSFQAKVLTPIQTVIPANLGQREDGALSVRFTSYIEGLHRLAICWGDTSIAGSPMNVNIRGDINYSPDTNILQELPLKHWKSNRKSLAAHTTFNGNIYVIADYKVYVLDAQYNLLSSFGEPDQVEFPVDIAIGPDSRVFLSDIGKHKILVFDESGSFIREFGSMGSDNGQLKYPLGIAADRYGNVAVCDTGNHRVQLFHPDGTFKFSFSDIGKSQDMWPVAIAFNSQGHIIVSQSSLMCLSRLNQSQNFDVKTAVECVTVFDSDGQPIRTIGEAGEGKGQFWAPSTVAVDSQDNIWVAEVSFGRIQVFDQQGHCIEVFTPNEERKGSGWISLLTTATNGAILYFRSYFGIE